MSAYFGLDFGTSNSTLAMADAAGLRLIALEGAAQTLPSAVFWPDDRGPLSFGRAALDNYLQGEEGRLLRGLKSTLGSAQYTEKTMLGGRMVGFSTVIEALIAHIKTHLDAARGDAPLRGIVLGRPVHFHDGDAAADARAQEALAGIAKSLGFHHVAFQLEPIAAALEYEARLTREQIVLIVDIGGGTSDFSILRLSPLHAQSADRSGDILATGGLRLGGTDFDRALSLIRVMPDLGYKASTKGGAGIMPNHYYLDLATWHKINALYTPRVAADIKAMRHEIDRPELLGRLARVIGAKSGHALAMRVEGAKIALSDAEAARILLSDLTGGPNPMATRADFAAATAAQIARISAVMDETITRAGLSAAQIGAVFLTGGAAHMPHLRAAVAGALPQAQLATGDMLGSVGMGLAREAQRRFG
ncbi:MAG: Hsp70 family protein [Cypionkella sp.]|nr:Hsp70 family protein [Cypionkella sp.]